MQCRKCSSTDVSFTKHIFTTKARQETYHYKLHCTSCKQSYYVSRTKEVYDQVKDKEWIIGKQKKQKKKPLTLDLFSGS